MDYVKRELSRGIGDWEQRLSTAMVKSSPTDLVRSQSNQAADKPADAPTASNRSADQPADGPNPLIRS
jgi:hypothetical protein